MSHQHFIYLLSLLQKINHYWGVLRTTTQTLRYHALTQVVLVSMRTYTFFKKKIYIMKKKHMIPGEYNSYI